MTPLNPTNIVVILLLVSGMACLAFGKERKQDQEEQAQVGNHGGPLPAGACVRLGRDCFRHDGNNSGLAFSPDGKILAGCCSGKIILWEAGTGRRIRQLPIGSAGWLSYHSLDFSPDGKMLAVAHGEPLSRIHRDKFFREISLWEVATGRYLRSVKPAMPNRMVGDLLLRFSPDGKAVAVTGKSNELIFMEIPTGTVRWFKHDLKISYSDFRFSPDGKLLALLSGPGTTGFQVVQLVELNTGKVLKQIKNTKGDATALAWSRDGKTIALGNSTCILLSDVVAGHEQARLKAKMEPVYDLAFSADGKSLVAAASSAKIFVWDIKSKKLRFTLDTGIPMNGPFRLALSPNSKTVAFGTPLSEVQLWDINTGKRLFIDSQGQDSWVRKVLYSPDGGLLAVAGDTGKINMWETKTWRCVRELGSNAQMLSFHPDGNRLLSVPFLPMSMFAPRDQIGNSIFLWDVPTGKQLRRISDPKADCVWWAAFSADGKKMVTAQDGKKVFNSPHSARIALWDASTMKQLRRFDGSLRNGSSNLVLVPGMIPKRTRVEKQQKNAEKTKGLNPFPEFVQQFDLVDQQLWSGAMTVSPDGMILVTSSEKIGEIQLWDILTRRPVLNFGNHKRMLRKVALSPDGRLLASTAGWPQHLGDSPDIPHIHLWDVVTGKQIASFTDGGFISSLTFSPDGNKLASGMDNGSVLIWDLKPFRDRLPKESKNLSAEEFELLWNDLTSEDGRKAYQAVWSLALANNSMAFLKKKILPPMEVPDAKIRRWIADLDNKKFNVRTRAARKLRQLGRQAEIALCNALKTSPSLEQKLRIETLIRELPETPVGSVRMLRTVQILGRSRSDAARRVLATLAQGRSTDAWTQQAIHALHRMKGGG
ncbi:MAG: WD40 repeat domain-containing protein, partial [Bdellovibrionales bacterium]